VRSSNGQPERVSPTDLQSVLTTVRAEHERTARQVESLQQVVASIVEASELTATDDEHDPEGATIAYERAQAIALLRQARDDLDALAVTQMQLESAQVVMCSVCGRTIDLERVATLPTTRRCIRCAV
jgi:RNA polymerase-binding transcription factor DksA